MRPLDDMAQSKRNASRHLKKRGKLPEKAAIPGGESSW
jgi:hypothetical protein